MKSIKMTISQAAEYLGRSRGTLYNWHHSHTLRYHKVGINTEYEAEDVVRMKHPTFSDADVSAEIERLFN